MPDNEFTLLIARARQGDADVEIQLSTRVFGELHGMARRIMSHDDTSLQPTALISNLFEKLFRNRGLTKTDNRRYFFTVAANQMRNMLIDHYRRKNTLKRGGDRERESLDLVLDNVPGQIEEQNHADLESLDHALDTVQQENPRQHELVMHRFSGGLTVEQTAQLPEIGKATAERDWMFARAKLFAELCDDDS